MAANTPPLSLRDQCDQFIQRRFDEVSNERDTAVSRLDKTITINKKLKNANSGCWHIIANKQLEINALTSEINALHDKIWQLEQDLSQETQKVKEITGTVTGEATHRNTSTQHGTPPLAKTKHSQIIIINKPSVSTSKDHSNEDVTTSEDVISQPGPDIQVIESDYSEPPQAAPKKRRRRKIKPVVKETSASKRSRREPKPIAQTEAVVNQDAGLSVSKFSINHRNEIVNEDGKALSRDIQAEFTQKMDELSTKNTCPRGNWRFAKRKGKCVRCQIVSKPSLWTVEGPRQYACKTCANSNAFCVLWNEDVSKYLVLPLPPQFAGEGLLQFQAESGKVQFCIFLEFSLARRLALEI